MNKSNKEKLIGDDESRDASHQRNFEIKKEDLM
jgi:hypothetical protein